MIYDTWLELLDFILPGTTETNLLVYIGMILSFMLLIMLFRGRK